MVQCCVCDREIKSEAPAILFIGKNGQEKLICDSCNRKAFDLFEGDSEKKRGEAVSYFLSYAKRIEDEEVEQFIQNAVSESGFIDADEAVEDPDMSESTAGFFLRIFAYTGSIIYAIGSIKIGIDLAELFDDGTLGVVIGFGGLLFAGIMLAGCLVYIDKAKDTRIIKNLLSYFKSRYQKKYMTKE